MLLGLAALAFLVVAAALGLAAAFGLTIDDLEEVLLVAAAFNIGNDRMFAELGVSEVVHCQEPFMNAHDMPSSASS